jgi:phosphate-selective porin
MLRDGLGTNFYGRMHQYTVALNWYWNPQTRWGLDWIYAKPISGTGGADETASSLNTLACQVRICF